MLTDTADTVEETSVSAMGTPVVLADVTKRYGRRRRAVPALDRVSLSFMAGSFTAVLGVSGSGKSSWPRRGWGWAAASCGVGPPNSPAASSSAWRSPGR
jgi:ABC-type glutathione transport system ATPase component